MDRRERMKAYITIVLSMILGLVCFALAGVFFSAAFAQTSYAQPVSHVYHVGEAQVSLPTHLVEY